MKVGSLFSSGGHAAALVLFGLVWLETAVKELGATGGHAAVLLFTHDVAVFMTGWTLLSLILEGAGEMIARVPALSWLRGTFATAATVAAVFFLLQHLSDRSGLGGILLVLSVFVMLTMGGELYRTLAARAEAAVDSATH